MLQFLFIFPRQQEEYFVFSKVSTYFRALLQDGNLGDLINKKALDS